MAAHWERQTVARMVLHSADPMVEQMAVSMAA